MILLSSFMVLFFIRVWNVIFFSFLQIVCKLYVIFTRVFFGHSKI